VAIFDLFHFILLLAISKDWWQWGQGCLVTGDRVWDKMVQCADMEGWVDSELGWQLEVVCVAVDHLFNFVWAIPLVI
jgi:hypothetical protein